MRVTTKNKRHYTEYIHHEFVAFDLETTGLNPQTARIIEIGAIRVVDKEIIDNFSTLIDPLVDIPPLITSITGITTNMIKGAPLVEHVLPEFFRFIQDTPIVAHNAKFDMGFLFAADAAYKVALKNPVIDTLKLTRMLFPHLSNHKLKTVAAHLGIENVNYHRSLSDSYVAAQVYLRCKEQMLK